MTDITVSSNAPRLLTSE